MRSMTTATIRDATRETGLSAHTLRYCEPAGLLRDVPRDDGCKRVFYARHLEWIRLLDLLRVTRMSVRKIRELLRRRKNR